MCFNIFHNIVLKQGLIIISDCISVCLEGPVRLGIQKGVPQLFQLLFLFKCCSVPKQHIWTPMF